MTGLPVCSIVYTDATAKAVPGSIVTAVTKSAVHVVASFAL
jgi:hypothetical protein